MRRCLHCNNQITKSDGSYKGMHLQCARNYEFAPEEETFEEYLKRTRREFCDVIRGYTVDDHSELRVAVDDLLIAFDQAVEKATKS